LNAEERMRPVSKGLNVLTVILLCLTIMIASGIGILVHLQNKNTPPPAQKKAFILIPGLMGSCLCDPQYDNAVVWSADTAWLTARMQEDPAFAVQYGAQFLSYGEDSSPITPLVPASSSAIRSDGYDLDPYGFGGSTKLLADYLRTQYADEGYDIITWQYDWRQTTQHSADLLEEFINSQGYTNVILFADEMGGNVVARYIRKSDNRAKVDLFMPFGTPFFGSLNMLDWLFPTSEAASAENPYGRYSELITLLNLSDYLSDLPAAALLLPYAAMSYLSVFRQGEGPILLNDTKVTFNELYDYICSQSFAKTDSMQLKTVYENLVEYQHRDFIEIRGKWKHVTEFVDTVFVVGTGIRTRYSADINTAMGVITNFKTDLNGDGSVWAYSASAGHSLNASNVIMVNAEEVNFAGYGHYFDNPDVLELIKNEIDAHVIRVQK
jgi:pimeloyl-ACP methyl ester carboxylesterase